MCVFERARHWPSATPRWPSAGAQRGSPVAAHTALAEPTSMSSCCSTTPVNRRTSSPHSQRPRARLAATYKPALSSRHERSCGPRSVTSSARTRDRSSRPGRPGRLAKPLLLSCQPAPASTWVAFTGLGNIRKDRDWWLEALAVGGQPQSVIGSAGLVVSRSVRPAPCAAAAEIEIGWLEATCLVVFARSVPPVRVRLPEE